MAVKVFLLMILLHVIDDFHLQGILGSMKQKEWWKKQDGYEEMYKYDYIVALIMHSFSWVFMMMLPIAIATRFNVGLIYYIGVLVNAVIHCFVDDLKANKKKISLMDDQLLHMMQILATYILFRAIT